MKYKHILVTGGAGFIGSHLVDGLIDKGYTVRVMDNLYRQIHPTGKLPDYFNKKAEFFLGDVTKKRDWIQALSGIDAVFHFASAVGVGQSMYEVAHYVKVNSYGTALFLDILANRKHSIKKVVVAASMSSYGEGTYRCTACGLVRPSLRDEKKLHARDYAVYCPSCGKEVQPVPTSEESKQNSNSIYAIGKKEQEEMVLTFGASYSIPSVALRFFNVYGPRQSLSNPYNGVAAIFMSRIKNGKPPLLNEDGGQTRDFVHVRDVVNANIIVLENSKADYRVFNVGSGKPVTIKEVALLLNRLYGGAVMPDVTHKVRKLDVRHCYADTTKLQDLGWKPLVNFEAGLKEVIQWSEHEEAVDNVDFAMKQLEKRGLR